MGEGHGQTSGMAQWSRKCRMRLPPTFGRHPPTFGRHPQLLPVTPNFCPSPQILAAPVNFWPSCALLDVWPGYGSSMLLGCLVYCIVTGYLYTRQALRSKAARAAAAICAARGMPRSIRRCWSSSRGGGEARNASLNSSSSARRENYLRIIG
jgi:hypothetical protein